jgi:hypothetical protein
VTTPVRYPTPAARQPRIDSVKVKPLKITADECRLEPHGTLPYDWIRRDG